MSNEDKKPTLVGTETFETKTNKELAEETIRLDNEMKALDLELKRDQVGKLRAQINQKLENAKTRDLSIKNYMKQREMQQDNCNHRKGGTGAEAFLTGQGGDANYAVIKHKLPCNKYFVLCQRCGKEWHPSQPLFGIEETPGYQVALGFLTNNVASGSSSFLFERTTAV